MLQKEKKNEGKVWEEGEEKQEEEEEEEWGWQRRSVSWWLLHLRVFLQPVFSYSAGRCRFFCQGGSQVWVREKVGVNGGGGFLIWILGGFPQNADSLSWPFHDTWLGLTAGPHSTLKKKTKNAPARVQKSLAVVQCSLHGSQRDITPR